MKKNLIALLILSLVAGCISVSAIATERGYISLNTSADTEVAPDIAEISFTVKTSDTKSIQKATVLNKETSEKVLSVLKGMLNTQKGDFIKTSNFNASPVYTYNGNKKNLEKYEVSNRVIVHTKSIDKVGLMVDKAIEAGATNVDSLNFSVSNYESECNSLIEAASKKANTRASIAAKSMNTALDGIRSMDISCSENKSYNTNRVFMAKNMLGAVADGAAAESFSTSIESGVIKIYANVNVTYFVK